MFKTCSITIFVAVLCATLLVGAPARAQSVNIQEVQSLTFPTLATTGGTVNYTISPLNSSGSGTAQVISGVPTRGQYALSLTSGGSPVSISLDISGINTGSTGLTLDSFQGYYKGTAISSFPSPTLPLPSTSPSTSTLYLGARAIANSTVKAGAYNGSFSITVFVQ